MEVITEVPTFELVAMKKVCTKGITSGFERMVPTSPRQKQKVTSMTKPRVPLIRHVQIIARGSTKEESLISSDMCTAESGPMKEKMGESMPTRQDRPILPQFPPSVNWVKTSSAVLRGANTQRGIRIAKKPQMWKIRTIPSTRGSLFAR